MNQFPNLIQRSLNLNREPNLSGSIIELKAIFRQEVYQAVIHHKALKPDDVGRYWLRQQFHNKILPPPKKKKRKTRPDISGSKYEAERFWIPSLPNNSALGMIIRVFFFQNAKIFNFELFFSFLYISIPSPHPTFLQTFSFCESYLKQGTHKQ